MAETNRRQFLVAAGATVGMVAAVNAAAQEGERINVGLIGVGIRGYQLHTVMIDSPHARIAAICDLSDHYIERIRARLKEPQIPVYRDYRELLADRQVDAVVIASPDHWHATMTLDALAAGKDVYVEKPLAYSLEEAIRVRDLARKSAQVTQVGYQRRSIGHYHRAREIIGSGLLGEIHQLQLWVSRNYHDLGPWRVFNDYSNGGLPRLSGPEHVDWERFQANRPPRPYDPQRFFHWQCYDEYSTGIFGILMSHPLDAANLVLDLGIPETVSATGGVFQYEDGRSVPDTCNAMLHYPSRKLTVSFAGSSTNAFFDQEAHYRGREGTLEVSPTRMRLFAEKRNGLLKQFASDPQAIGNLRTDALLEERAQGDSTTAHLEDFFAAVRNRKTTLAPIEACFPAMVAVAMAIESYQSGRTVRWDDQADRIVPVG
jgi:predicted dehydrogenase